MIVICTNIETLTSGYPSLVTPTQQRDAADEAIAAAESCAARYDLDLDRDSDYRHWHGGAPANWHTVGGIVAYTSRRRRR